MNSAISVYFSFPLSRDRILINNFITGMTTDPIKADKKNFMAPFYGWGSTASRLEPLRGGSLLFTTKFPEIPATHFIDLGRMKC